MKAVICVAITLLLTTNATAQIPVTDGASIAQRVTQQIETLAKWKMQYEQMTNQITQARQQYQSLTGVRGFGKILNNPALRNYLPNDWQSVYDDVRNGGYSGLSGRAQTIYNDNKIYDGCANIAVDQDRVACEARAVKPSQDKALALDAYDAAQSRIDQIDQLMGKIDETQDPKAIAELQARIASEQASIQNEQTKLKMYAMVAAAEDRVQAQRQREIQKKIWSSRKGVEVQPLTFNK